MEGRVDGAVEGILGARRLSVEEEAGLADLLGETVGRCRAARLVLLDGGGGRFGERVARDQLLQRGSCGLFRGDLDIVIVNWFPLEGECQYCRR